MSAKLVEKVQLTVATLRSHEVVGPFSFAQTVIIVSLKQLTYTKVSKFCLCILSNQDVLRFNISVHDVVNVH